MEMEDGHPLGVFVELDKGRIAIARDFGIVLNDDSHLTLVGRNDGFRQLHTSERVIKVAAAFAGYMGLTNTRRVVTCGSAREFERSEEIERWHFVKDVVACEGHTAAVFADGTVGCVDEPGGWEGVPNHSKVVKAWRHIKQVAVGYANVMGLTEDGRVVYHSVDGRTDCHFYDSYSDVVQVDCYSHYYGKDSSAVLHRDGTVSSDTFEGVKAWRDIVQISVGADVVIGLKRDGSIEMLDDRNLRYEARRGQTWLAWSASFSGSWALRRMEGFCPCLRMPDSGRSWGSWRF